MVSALPRGSTALARVLLVMCGAICTSLRFYIWATGFSTEMGEETQCSVGSSILGQCLSNGRAGFSGQMSLRTLGTTLR